MHRLRTLVAVLGLGLAALAPPPPGLAAAGAPAPARDQVLASTGYVLDDAPDGLVAREAHALSTLGVDGVTLSRRGTDVSTIDPRLAATAHAHGLRAELLLSNYSDRLGDFDPRAAARLLRSPAHVQQVAARLASYVATQGWDGVQVDLESMPRRASWSRAPGRGPAGAPWRASGPPGCATGPGCGGLTVAPSRCASSSPSTSACTASRCGGWARPTRSPDPLRPATAAPRSAGRAAPPPPARPTGVRR